MCFNVIVDEDCMIFEEYQSLNTRYLKYTYNSST